MRKLQCLVVLAIAGSVESVEPEVRAIDRATVPPALREADTVRQASSRDALARVRAAARRADPSGRAHYRLAVAVRDFAARRAGTGDGDALERLLLEGVEAGEKAWTCRPTSSRYATVLGDLHGQLASRLGGLARVRHGRRAAELYARAVQLDPGNPLAHVGVGISSLETPVLFGGSLPRALKAFRTAQRIDPRCVEAWIWEAVALRRQGLIRRARQALMRALTLDPGSRHARRELEALDEDFPD